MSNPGKNNAKISNQPSGGGNKLQGLAPKATHFYMAPYTGQQYNTGTYAPNRFRLVCMNQLGGIGSRYNSQFAPTADGTSTCPEESSNSWFPVGLNLNWQSITSNATGSLLAAVVHFTATFGSQTILGRLGPKLIPAIWSTPEYWNSITSNATGSHLAACRDSRLHLDVERFLG